MAKGSGPPAQKRDETPQILLERALGAAGEGIVIADARQPDMPLIYVNAAFEAVTGYSRAETLGRNCRFLQGPETAPGALEEIRRAVAGRRGVVVELLNYRKDGTPFWNRLSITPVHDAAGEVTHFIGVQSDVTARRVAENRLEAANREVRRDLEAAARIQKSLLPGADAQLPGIEVAWMFRPCQELAGDMLNFLRLDAGTLALFMLDVSGHGVPAALLSFTVAHTLMAPPDQSSLFERRGEQWAPAPPAAVAATLNRRFKLDPAIPKYFTLFYALLDAASGRMRYVSAGHPLAVLAPAHGTQRLLLATGPPIGIVEEAQFREEIVTLGSGDRLVVFTDGLSEALSPDGGELGVDRVLETVAAYRERPVRECVEALGELGVSWSGGSLHDDVSVGAIERTSA